MIANGKAKRRALEQSATSSALRVYRPTRGAEMSSRFGLRCRMGSGGEDLDFES